MLTNLRLSLIFSIYPRRLSLHVGVLKNHFVTVLGKCLNTRISLPHTRDCSSSPGAPKRKGVQCWRRIHQALLPCSLARQHMPSTEDQLSIWSHPSRQNLWMAKLNSWKDSAKKHHASRTNGSPILHAPVLPLHGISLPRFKVTGKHFAHATGPLVNNVRSRAEAPVRFFHVKF